MRNAMQSTAKQFHANNKLHTITCIIPFNLPCRYSYAVVACMQMSRTHNLIHHLIYQRGKVINDLDMFGIQVCRLGKSIGQGRIIKLDTADILVFLLGHYSWIDGGAELRQRQRPRAAGAAAKRLGVESSG